ncbi:MAG TPA: methyltransferase [Chitinophagales bacterium]|nr:methyltransferase [Chitinophagales bacterium]
MRKLYKLYSRIWLQPRVRKRMQQSAMYTHGDIRLFIPPGVFHPGYFHSTQFLLDFTLRHPLTGKHILELGAGSGLISIATAKKGAVVTASDINQQALQALQQNAEHNQVKLQIVYSDLFGSLEGMHFDYILINPPFYPQDARNDLERAWYAGLDFQYFQRLFAGIHPFLPENTEAWMILSEDTSTVHIEDIAHAAGLHMEVIEKKRILWEWNYIYKLTKA